MPLVERMRAAGRSAAVEALAALEVAGAAGAMQPSRTFRFGFHTVPSMPQLHLHVISQDLRGGRVAYPCYPCPTPRSQLDLHVISQDCPRRSCICM